MYLLYKFPNKFLSSVNNRVNLKVSRIFLYSHYDLPTFQKFIFILITLQLPHYPKKMFAKRKFF